MGQDFLKPIDIKEGEFGEGFKPSVLDSDHPEREKAGQVVLKVLKKTASLINASLRRNADALLRKIDYRKDILWAGEQRIPEGKFALTY